MFFFFFFGGRVTFACNNDSEASVLKEPGQNHTAFFEYPWKLNFIPLGTSKSPDSRGRAPPISGRKVKEFVDYFFFSFFFEVDILSILLLQAEKADSEH